MHLHSLARILYRPVLGHRASTSHASPQRSTYLLPATFFEFGNRCSPARSLSRSLTDSPLGRGGGGGKPPPPRPPGSSGTCGCLRVYSSLSALLSPSFQASSLTSHTQGALGPGPRPGEELCVAKGPTVKPKPGQKDLDISRWETNTLSTAVLNWLSEEKLTRPFFTQQPVLPLLN